MKKVYVVLECEVDNDADILDLNEDLYALNRDECSGDGSIPACLKTVNYWHVSTRGYDEKLPPKKKKRKKAA